MSRGNLLIATGGALKPEKCFYYLMSYEFNERNGSWYYSANHDSPDFALVVPMPDGSTAPISHLAVTKSRKMLGASQCPTGTAAGSIALLQERTQSWVDRVMNGSSNRRQVWFSMDHQLQPKLLYGMCCNTGSLNELDQAIQKQLYTVIPKGGLIRTVPKRLRDLDRGFYGGGATNVSVGVSVVQTNKLLMYYGCSTSVGLFLQTSMELLAIELGYSASPLQLDYGRHGHMVTHCWLKTVWKKLDRFKFQVQVHNVGLTPPRGEKDGWLMQRFEDAGYSLAELCRLNKVRIHQQVIFLSDVLRADGLRLDGKYLQRRPSSAT